MFGSITISRMFSTRATPTAVWAALEAAPRWPEVLTGYALTGQWDYSLKVVARDLDAYAHFLMDKVLALPVVVNVQSAFVLETVKDTTALPLA